MKTFTFEIRGQDGKVYCLNFECETIEQLEDMLIECRLIPESYGELIYSKEIE